MSSVSWVQMIKQIAMDAVRAAKLTDYQVGTVTAVSPLKVKLSNTMTLDADFLQVTRNVTDYECTIEIDRTDHTCTVKNALKAGDKVLLIRKSGGQKYVIIDKVVS